MPILWPLKVPERGNAITQRKPLEIEHSCLFIHHTISIYPFPHLILFNTPKKSLLKSSYPSQIFVPKKILELKISNQEKNPSIIPVTWNPKYPPWGGGGTPGLQVYQRVRNSQVGFDINLCWTNGHKVSITDIIFFSSQIWPECCKV